MEKRVRSNKEGNGMFTSTVKETQIQQSRLKNLEREALSISLSFFPRRFRSTFAGRWLYLCVGVCKILWICLSPTSSLRLVSPASSSYGLHGLLLFPTDPSYYFLLRSHRHRYERRNDYHLTFRSKEIAGREKIVNRWSLDARTFLCSVRR